MKKRVAQMERVAAVRVLQERLCEAASVRATGDVRVVECALSQTEQARCAAEQEGRAALVDGDRSQWLLTDAMREVAGWNRSRLEILRVERVRDAAVKATAWQQSVLRQEQVGKMTASLRDGLEVAAARSAQAESDDRFLSRRSWNREKALTQGMKLH